MRVLHFIPDIGISNGVMSFILNYAKAMPEDIVFDVVYFHEKEKTRQGDIESLGGKVYKTDRPSPKDLTGKKLDSFFSAHKGEWSALHINAPHFAAFIAPAAKRAGIEKICVHCHTSEYSLKGNSLRNKMLGEYSNHFIKDRFACSVNAGKLWYGNKPFQVITNAIDCKKYAYNTETRDRKRNELSLGEDFTVCHIGRTDIPQKNHSFILKVFAKLTENKPYSKLVLIGAEETEELKSLSDKLGITDRIIYLGFRADVAELLSACDVFLFPSTSEGLPVSVIEAQAASLPVLMSDAVTEEAAVTEYVTRLSLDAAEEEWAAKLFAISEKQRASVDIPEWDINVCSKKLIDYYKA